MYVANISTTIKAVTGNAEDIGNYFATLSGSVDNAEGAARYIRYWSTESPEEVYTTEVMEGGGDYKVEVTNLLPETEYQYQMTENGEIKSFVTNGYYYAEPGDDDPIPPTEETPAPQNPTPTPTIEPTPEPTLEPAEIAFEILDARIDGNAITANIANMSDKTQSGIAILASYNVDGTLVKAQSADVDNITAGQSMPVVFDLPEGADKHRILIWNSLRSIGPMAEPVEVR